MLRKNSTAFLQVLGMALSLLGVFAFLTAITPEGLMADFPDMIIYVIGMPMLFLYLSILILKRQFDNPKK